MGRLDVTQLLQRLQTDKTSGATTLAELAIDIVEAFLAEHDARKQQELAVALEGLVGAVVAAQPSMAVMIDLAQVVLQACAEGFSPESRTDRLRHALMSFRRNLRDSTQALCQRALGIFPPQASVLTYSNSATVTAVLCHAQAHRGLRRVLLSEARPAYDGRPQAHALVEAGIAVEYTIDAGLFGKLAEADLVVVGADAVFPEYFVNKVGTNALARLAHAQGIPCFCLCAVSKFLPAAASVLLRIVDHPGDEVWPHAPPGVHVHNRYFEETPLALLTGIVSDQDVHSPEAVRLMLEHRPLPTALLQLVSSQVAGKR